VSAQPFRQEWDQGGQYRSVGPVQAWLRVLPAKDRVLVAQYEDLNVLGGAGTAEETQPPGEPAQHQVEHSHRHDQRSFTMSPTEPHPPRSTPASEFWNPTGSMPSSSASLAQVLEAASASACCPARCSAGMSWPRKRSRSARCRPSRPARRRSRGAARRPGPAPGSARAVRTPPALSRWNAARCGDPQRPLRRRSPRVHASTTIWFAAAARDRPGHRELSRLSFTPLLHGLRALAEFPRGSPKRGNAVRYAGRLDGLFSSTDVLS
jgi:hypothetical protein